MPPSPNEARSLRYVCDGCATPLVLPASRAGVNGPCPKCRKWIDASNFVFPEMPSPAAVPQLPDAAPPPPVRKRMQTGTTGKGRIRADGFLDHGYNERKELFSTLRVLAVFAAAGAVIFFVFLYMRDWMTK